MGAQEDDDYAGMGLTRASEMRAQVWTSVLYRLPLLALLGMSFAFSGVSSCLLLFVGAFRLLSDFFDLLGLSLRIGAFVGAYALGAPLWLVLTIAGVSTVWRGLVTWGSNLFAKWFPSPPGTYAWKAECVHLADSGKPIQTLIELGRWSDALDASLQALADHPRERRDCLAELALMTAEVAAAAGAPEIAIEAARAAPRLTDSQSKTHRAVDVRSFTAKARADADQGNFERAWSAIERAGKNTGGTRRLEGPVNAVTAGISAFTKRSSADPDKLVAAAANNLGMLGDAAEVTLLDFADWYRIAGRPRDALDLYDLTRTATEFDRFIGDIERVPLALNRRWSLRGRRWARAVHGQLQCRLDLDDTPSKPLMAAAESAAIVLTNLGETPALVQLLATVAAAKSRAGLDAHPTVEAVYSLATRHRYVVLDKVASHTWEVAAKRAQSALGPLEGTRSNTAKATWLADAGTDVARSGLVLARALDDVLANRLDVALRTLSVGLGEIGLKEEALASAEELVSIRRETVDAGMNPTWNLGFPLYRLGICLEDVGRRDEGIAAHLESLQYFRQSAAKNESERLTCAQVVSRSVYRLFDAKRYDEALPLSLETVRRYTELSPDNPSDDIDRVTQKLAQVYDRLERFADSAETNTKLAESWESSTADPLIAHAGAAESYWRASRSWRSTKRLDDEFTCLQKAYDHLSLIDDPEYSREWQGRRRRAVGSSLGMALVNRGRTSDAIAPLLSAFEISLQLPHDAEGDWIDNVEHAAYWLAITYFRADQIAEAQRTVEQGLAALPDDTDKALWLHYAGYLASTSLGNSVQATTYLNSAIASANTDSDEDPHAVQVLTRCVVFIAAGDQVRALGYIAAATSGNRVPDGETLRLLWGDLADLESVIGPSPAIDQIRTLLPLAPRVGHE